MYSIQVAGHYFRPATGQGVHDYWYTRRSSYYQFNGPYYKNKTPGHPVAYRLPTTYKCRQGANTWGSEAESIERHAKGDNSHHVQMLGGTAVQLFEAAHRAPLSMCLLTGGA